MINRRVVLFVFAIATLLSSCNSIHRHFSYYKEPILSNSSKKVRLDGIYVVDCKDTMTHIDLFYFYKNGVCNAPAYVIWLRNRFCEYSHVMLERYKNLVIEFPQNSEWGNYVIRHDSIFIQTFHEFNQSTVIRDMVEFRGIISNDSTILITEMECAWCNRGFMNEKTGPDVTKYDPPIQFNFYPYDFKPDSTVAWFKNKRWYKKGLHPSRK